MLNSFYDAVYLPTSIRNYEFNKGKVLMGVEFTLHCSYFFLAHKSLSCLFGGWSSYFTSLAYRYCKVTNDHWLVIKYINFWVFAQSMYTILIPFLENWRVLIVFLLFHFPSPWMEKKSICYIYPWLFERELLILAPIDTWQICTITSIFLLWAGGPP